jgi:hypothetical protein
MMQTAKVNFVEWKMDMTFGTLIIRSGPICGLGNVQRELQQEN